MISSTYSAAQARFRPIIMTVLCMIFGMLPLMFSSGAGANGNSSLHVCLWEFHFRYLFGSSGPFPSYYHDRLVYDFRYASADVLIRCRSKRKQFTSRLSVGVPLQMLSNRPDVRMAERDLEQAFYVTNQANSAFQAFYVTNQANSAFYPSITLSGSAGWTNSVGGPITNPGKFVTSALASLAQPLFNRGTLIARRRIAKAQQEEALLAFEQKLLDAGTEVNEALVSYQNEALVSYQISKRKKDNYENQVAALEKAFTSTSLLMQHGNTTYLEVLTARQTLLNAQLSQTANCFKEIQSLINLYQVLGGGQHI